MASENIQIAEAGTQIDLSNKELLFVSHYDTYTVLYFEDTQVILSQKTMDKLSY